MYNPKIHKSKIIKEQIKKSNTEYIHIECTSDLTARPIVAGPVSPTQRLSELLEKFMTPNSTTFSFIYKRRLGFHQKTISFGRL